MDKDTEDKTPQPAAKPPTEPEPDKKPEPEAKAAPADKDAPAMTDKPGADAAPATADKPAADAAPATTDKPAPAPPPATADKPAASASPAAGPAPAPADKPASSTDDTVRSVTPPKLHDTRESPRVVLPPEAVPLSGTDLIGSTTPPGQMGQPLDRKATERRWLESKTKEELVDLILELEQKQPGLDVTEKMMKVQLAGPISPPADSFKIPDDLPYLRLPVVRKERTADPSPTWRIVLVSLEQNNKPLGLIIDSEITIGRAAGEANPDLDLTPFGASIKGVSRIHARLRPSVNSLVLIDANSSNGTYCNRSRIPPNAEQPLKEGDVVAFGQAYFLVRVVKSPDMKGTKTLI